MGPRARNSPEGASGGGAPCPICEKPAARGGRAFPFCSQRCRLVDLGRWFGGQYGIECPPETSELDDFTLEGPDEGLLSGGTP